MSRTAPPIVAYAIAVVAGVLAWDLVRLLGGRYEAWDDPNYWLIGYPLMLIAAFVLGMGFPERPWRWAVTIVGAQAAWSLFLALAAGGVSNLLPLGLVTFALLGVPCVGAAYVGKWIGDRVPT